MRKILPIIGAICIIIALISFEDKPERMYATRPYGKGIVREHNYFARTMNIIGFGCIGIWGCIKFFEGEKK